MGQLIAFESVIDNGYIQIPDEYRTLCKNHISVTVILNDSRDFNDMTRAGALSPDDFIEIELDTKDWKFNREEANERR